MIFLTPSTQLPISFLMSLNSRIENENVYQPFPLEKEQSNLSNSLKLRNNIFEGTEKNSPW